MPTIPVNVGERAYRVQVERGLLGRAGETLRTWLAERPLLVVSDTNVAPLHGKALLVQLPPGTGFHVSPAGEDSKSLTELGALYAALGGRNIPRDGAIVALGGGVVCDLAGFAAATWLRGIPWVAIPTSLLAMVDASVGGKVAINHSGLKNQVGAFHQPAGVLADPEVLATLPEKEFLSGLAEVLKSACLDAAFYAWLRPSWPAILAGRAEALEAAICGAVRVKAGIVARDEQERGERRHLNLGHTVGHALEAAVGGGLTHGACVAVGLIFATLLAEETGYADPGYAAQVRSLALPLIPPGLAIPPWPVLESLIAHDKKMTADGAIRWVLPVGPGEVSVVAGLPERALAAGWTRLPGALTPASSGAGA